MKLVNDANVAKDDVQSLVQRRWKVFRVFRVRINCLADFAQSLDVVLLRLQQLAQNKFSFFGVDVFVVAYWLRWWLLLLFLLLLLLRRHLSI